MQPGISRALVMGFVGFLAGALIVLVVRGLQNMDPLWDPEVALVLCAFTTSGFFLYGIGAFDPRASLHGEEAVARAYAQQEERSPASILFAYVWRISAIVALVFVGLFAFANLPTGFTIVRQGEALGSYIANGYSTLPLPWGGVLEIGGQPVVFSEFTLLVIFAIITVISLIVVAGALGFLFYFLNRNTQMVRATPPAESELTPPLPIRLVGRFFGWLARVLKQGLPWFFGYR